MGILSCPSKVRPRLFLGSGLSDLHEQKDDLQNVYKQNYLTEQHHSCSPCQHSVSLSSRNEAASPSHLALA